MEYKFLRLHKEETDYTGIITALKGYQFATHARPLSIPSQNGEELPEQLFMRKWASSPVAVSDQEIGRFLEKVEEGLCEELQVSEMDSRRRELLERIGRKLQKVNAFIREKQAK